LGTWVLVAHVLSSGASVAEYDYGDKAEEWQGYTAKSDTDHDLPTGLMDSLVHQESNWEPEAVSNRDAVGIAQIIPKWHPDVDPTDPVASINYAGSYVRRNLDRFDGKMDRALAAYNMGPTALQEHLDENGGEMVMAKLPLQTRNYITQILGRLDLKEDPRPPAPDNRSDEGKDYYAQEWKARQSRTAKPLEGNRTLK
jgi:soluble lytic murein transglycosylase-like protein